MKIKTPLFSLFDQFPNLTVLLSEENDSGMKIRYELENDEKTIEKREKFFAKHNILPSQVVVARLAQGNGLAVILQNDAGKIIAQTDGFLTSQKEIFLSITVADCLPVYLYDPKKQVVGLLHAGWRGLDTHIIDKAIDILRETFKVSAQTLLVGIGPGIGSCHFEVKRDVLEKFLEYPYVQSKKDNAYFLNLKQIAKLQLIKNNVQEEHIEINPLCTYCEKNQYFSYRRDKSIPVQAMVACIGMR